MLRDSGERSAGAPNDADRFAAGLLDPSCATPDLVSGPGGKRADKRYDVYRNNVTVSLIDAVAAIYPAVKRITGADFFRAMARAYVRQAPPTSPLLFEYGRGFPAFIDAYEHAADLPWLGDVARIERAWLDAYHAADAEPLSSDALSRIPPEQLAALVFTPHPASAIVTSRFAAATIFAANRNDEAFDTISAGVTEAALICRPEHDVIVYRLPRGETAFLTALMQGRQLGEAAGAAFDGDPDFDLAAAIASMLRVGVFTGVSVDIAP